MIEAYICDAVRTPIGRFGGALSSVRTDDLATIPIATFRTCSTVSIRRPGAIAALYRGDNLGKRLIRLTRE